MAVIFPRLLFAGLVLAVGLQVAKPANASLMAADDPVFGVGAITRDTSTSLDWLDVTHSIGMQYNDVAGQFGAGGSFEGWRFATGSEVLELWASFGIPNIDTAYSEANYAPVLELLAFVGCTGGCGGELDFIFAMTSDIASPTEVFAYWAQVNESAFDPPRARARSSGVILREHHSPISDIASWLVRPVPLPAAAWLFLMSLSVVGVAVLKGKVTS